VSRYTLNNVFSESKRDGSTCRKTQYRHLSGGTRGSQYAFTRTFQGSRDSRGRTNILNMLLSDNSRSRRAIIASGTTVTYVVELYSPPTYDLTTLGLFPGFIRRFEDGRTKDKTLRHAFTLLCHKLTPTSYSEVDQNRKESTELATRTSLKDIKQTTQRYNQKI